MFQLGKFFSYILYFLFNFIILGLKTLHAEIRALISGSVQNADCSLSTGYEVQTRYRMQTDHKTDCFSFPKVITFVFFFYLISSSRNIRIMEMLLANISTNVLSKRSAKDKFVLKQSVHFKHDVAV